MRTNACESVADSGYTTRMLQIGKKQLDHRKVPMSRRGQLIYRVLVMVGTVWYDMMSLESFLDWLLGFRFMFLMRCVSLFKKLW